MRRSAVALGIVAILASSCGEAAIPPRLATTLENRVAKIRELAEDGRPGVAIAVTRDLMSLVTDRLDAGQIDDAEAVEILEAAQLVVRRLDLVPRQTTESPSPIPSPSPSEEDEGKPDKDEEDKGDGHDEEGDGNEGSGND